MLAIIRQFAQRIVLTMALSIDMILNIRFLYEVCDDYRPIVPTIAVESAAQPVVWAISYGCRGTTPIVLAIENRCRAVSSICVALLFHGVLLNYEGWALERGGPHVNMNNV